MSGADTITYPDRGSYRGNCAEGQIAGEGRAFHANGIVQPGIFSNGTLNGPGWTRLADGTEEHGAYEQGHLVRKG